MFMIAFFIGGQMKKRVIVDLDGTIIPKFDVKESVIKCFERNGIERREIFIKGFLRGMKEYEIFHSKYDIFLYYEYLKRYSKVPFSIELIQDYLSHIEYLVPQKDTIEEREFLEKIYADYEVVALSNFFKEVEEKRLEYLHLRQYFTEIYGGEEYTKPDERAYEMALGSHPMEECIMIGDDYNLDYIGAKRIGLDAIYYHQEGCINNNEEVNALHMIKIER